MDLKKKLIIVGAVLLVVALALAILLFCRRSKSEDAMTAEEPKFDIKDLINMTPGDGSVLVAFQGFTKYLSEKYGKKRYLPLAPVTSIEVTNGEAFQNVKFDSAFGSVWMGMTNANGSPLYRIQNITIDSKDGDAEKSCYIKNAFIFYTVGAHLDCVNALAPLACVRDTKDKDGKWVELLVAELTISAIRAEMNGYADDHQKGEFSYETKECRVF